MLVYLLTTAQVGTAGLSMKATVDRIQVAVNESFMLTVKISGGSANVPQPQWSQQPAGFFDVYAAGRAQNVTIVNGQVSSSVTFRYTLVPRKTGTLTIPPLTIAHEGKTYRSAPINVTVTKAPASTPGAGQAAAQPGEPQLFVTGKLNKRRAHVGEQVIYTFRFYRRVQLLSRPRFVPPAFSGFVSEDLRPKEIQLPHQGIGYQVSELRYALFPIAPGTYTINPATLQVNVASVAHRDPFMAFFQGGKTHTLQTDPITLTVLALPDEGRPPQFSGAVGSYRISAALDHTTVEAGRPVTLSVEIAGKGLVRSLKEPAWPQIQSTRRYETITSLNVTNSGDAIRGAKTFKAVLIPQSTGRITIPAIVYPVFDPSARRYVTLRTQPLKLTVKPGPATQAKSTLGQPGAAPAGVKTLERDIRFLKAAYDSRGPRHPTPALPPATYWGVQAVPVAFFLVGWAVALRRRKLLGDPLGVRARHALRTAGLKLKQAESHVRTGDRLNFHMALKEALSNYLADKWGLSAPGLTLLEIQHRLQSKGLPENTVHTLRELWEEADLIRYAPSATTSADMADRLAQARALLQGLERNL